MTEKMIIHIILIVLMYAYLKWMLVRKRKRMQESSGPLLIAGEVWLLVGSVIVLVVNGVMLITDFQLRAGRTMAVSVMAGVIGCFLLAFIGPNFRMFIYLIELLVENSKRKKSARNSTNEYPQK